MKHAALFVAFVSSFVLAGCSGASDTDDVSTSRGELGSAGGDTALPGTSGDPSAAGAPGAVGGSKATAPGASAGGTDTGSGAPDTASGAPDTASGDKASGDPSRPGVACGRARCRSNEICCNPLASICTKAGEACII